MIRAFSKISRTAAVLAGLALPIVMVAAIPAVAQLEMLPQRPTQSPTRPSTRPPQAPSQAPGQPAAPAAPSAVQVAPQLESCQNWVSRVLSNVPRSSINVSPRAGTPVGGIIDIVWRIQDGTERGLCRVRRNGTILEGVRNTSSGLIHYFPASPNEVGEPIQ